VEGSIDSDCGGHYFVRHIRHVVNRKGTRNHFSSGLIRLVSNPIPLSDRDVQRLTEVKFNLYEGQFMNELEQRIRFGVGSAAAAAAIFAPINYKWKGLLSAVATDAILTGIYGASPVKRLFRV
jgi:hypothetical protein